MAGEKNNLKIAKFLVEKGCDVNGKSKHGAPLYYAVKKNSKDVAEFLIDKGADIHQENQIGETPLYLAAYSGSVESVKLLLSKGARVDTRTKKLSNTLLHAVAGGQGKDEKDDSRGKIAWLLIESGADLMH